jgi:CPA2 family monovalent cation:H+ antiporter-2
MLRRVHADTALGLIITMDEPRAAERAVRNAHSEWPLLPIYARARDAHEAAILMQLGASEVVPETVESSLQLGGRVLAGLGAPEEVLSHRINHERRFQRGASARST